jgi:hypothetical protein
MIKQNKFVIIGIGVFFISVLIVPLVFRVFNTTTLTYEYYCAIIGTAITAVITLLLLRSQSSSEEKRDITLRVFEKKQDIYHEFLNKLETIVQDDTITTNGSVKETDELKMLLFQLGLIQLHTKPENTQSILKEVGDIINAMNLYKSKSILKPDYYHSFSTALFNIVSTLKNDLYQHDTHDQSVISSEAVKRILTECGIWVTPNNQTGFKKQMYFWLQLRSLLTNVYDYEVLEPEHDFSSQINAFYSEHKPNPYGLSIKLDCNGKKIFFNITMYNEFVFGFPTKGNENLDREKMRDILSRMDKTYLLRSTKEWYGNIRSRKFCLFFNNPESPAFSEFDKEYITPDTSGPFISGLASEINTEIQLFNSIATEVKL